MLAVEGVSVAYRKPTGQELPVLQPMSLTIEDGEFVAVLGPSGCGKSTLIRVIAGLQTPTRGRVLVNGEPIKGASPEIALMFQDASLMPWRTVWQNIALPLELSHVAVAQHEGRITPLLDSLGLAEFSHAYPGELSGGMAQRVALARVLVQDPRVLLLDEPFGALDALTREQISLDLLRIWASHKQTCLMVTHNITEAVLMADRIVVMSRRPAQLLADIAVNLSRPRRLDDIYTPAFIDIARRVRTEINRA